MGIANPQSFFSASRADTRRKKQASKEDPHNAPTTSGSARILLERAEDNGKEKLLPAQVDPESPSHVSSSSFTSHDSQSLQYRKRRNDSRLTEKSFPPSNYNSRVRPRYFSPPTEFYATPYDADSESLNKTLKATPSEEGSAYSAPARTMNNVAKRKPRVSVTTASDGGQLSDSRSRKADLGQPESSRMAMERGAWNKKQKCRLLSPRTSPRQSSPLSDLPSLCDSVSSPQASSSSPPAPPSPPQPPQRDLSGRITDNVRQEIIMMAIRGGHPTSQSRPAAASVAHGHVMAAGDAVMDPDHENVRESMSLGGGLLSASPKIAV
jgi:hypothetical protein